ncbi:MAG: hypothetical protein JXX28_09595 [Deltaproteobacteria bacterium]|nr:hypothetical protein [Deltaproteobacteria bacterium]
MRALSLLPLSLLACGADPEPAALPDEAAEVVMASQDVIAATLVVAETSKHVAERSDRDGGTCPAVTRTGTLQEFTVVADYGAGCVPESGLVATEVAGAVEIDYADRALTVQFDALSADGHGVDGTITGSYDGVIGGLTLTLDTDLTLAAPDTPERVTESLVLGVGATELEVDGSASATYADGSSYSLAAAGIVLAYSDLATCPVPGEGVITVDNAGVSTTLTFLGGGLIEVLWNEVRYEIDGCAYLSGLY